MLSKAQIKITKSAILNTITKYSGEKFHENIKDTILAVKNIIIIPLYLPGFYGHGDTVYIPDKNKESFEEVIKLQDECFQASCIPTSM